MILTFFNSVSKKCPADGVWRIGRGGSPDRVLKTWFTPSESSAGHGLPPQKAPKQCPANGVRRILWGLVSRHGLLDTVKKHMVFELFVPHEVISKKQPQMIVRVRTKPSTVERNRANLVSRSKLDESRAPGFSRRRATAKFFFCAFEVVREN